MILLFLAVFLVLVKLKLQHKDITLCDVESFVVANPKTAKVNATKVLVEPWRGRHRVYAVFIVPMLYESGYPVLLDIKGVNTICRRATLVSRNGFDGISPPQNSTVIKLFLRTRTALWLTIMGKINDLEQLDNWTLTYSYYPNCIGTCRNRNNFGDR
ncbi:MAG: hypothetical protein WBM44_24700 [Waterburya sp.]